MSIISLHSRLSRVSHRLAAASLPDHSAHWKRVNDQRMQNLEAIAEIIPDSHADLFMETAKSIAPRLFVAGPAREPEESPLIQRWLMQRVWWGRDHTSNSPFPGAYLDLLLAHPDSVLGHTCRNCGIPVPSTRNSGEPGVNFRWSKPLVSTCPVCGAPIPPARRA